LDRSAKQATYGAADILRDRNIDDPAAGNIDGDATASSSHRPSITQHLQPEHDRQPENGR